MREAKPKASSRPKEKSKYSWEEKTPSPRRSRSPSQRRSISPSPSRRRMQQKPRLTQSHAAKAPIGSSSDALTIEGLQDQIKSVKSKMGTLVRVVAEKKPPQVAVPGRAKAISGDVYVPRATAHKLNEALLRSLNGCQQIRQALEVYERGAKSNEALVDRAQAGLSNLLTGE